MEIELALKPVTRWLDQQELKTVYSSEFWNDLSEEQKKEWWITEGADSYKRLKKFLEESGLIRDYRLAEQFISRISRQDLAVADLAAGIGWTSVLMSKLPNVGSVHAVEISQHRIEKLLPKAIRMFEGEAAKINRYIGSFYNLGFENGSMDVVLLSQAFHHAANPLRLLTEIDRILKPGGRMILIGENYVGFKSIVRRFIKTLLVQKRICSNFYELFPPADDSGDHYYRISDYRFFMQLMGYEVVDFSVQKTSQSMVVVADKTTL
jgi:ubiquinone/menaquinone biosynthesis C-methylase UbiE